MKNLSIYTVISELLKKNYPCFLPLSEERYDILINTADQYLSVLVKTVRMVKGYPVVDLGTSVWKDKERKGALYTQEDYDILICTFPETNDFWMFDRQDVPDVATVYLGQKYDSYRLIPHAQVEKTERKPKEVLQDDITTAIITTETQPEPDILQEASRVEDDEIKNILKVPSEIESLPNTTIVPEVLDGETRKNLQKLYDELEDDVGNLEK